MAGGILIAVGIGLVILAVWLLEPDEGAPASATSTPTPSPTATARPSVTAAPSPTGTATATPPIGGGALSIAAWDGARWRDDFPLRGVAYREGQTVPVLLKIEPSHDGTTYPITVRYECRAFDYLTNYDDGATGPALAEGGPGSAVPDASALIPNDPATAADDELSGALSAWGGSFAAMGPLLPPDPCLTSKTLEFAIAAARGSVYVLFAAHIAAGAAASNSPLGIDVALPGDHPVGLAIDPAGVRPQ